MPSNKSTNKNIRKKPKKQKKNRFVKFLILISTLLIISIVIFFATYYAFTEKSYEAFNTNINNFIYEIDSINKNLSNLNKNNTIDETVILESFPSTIKNLKDIKSEIQNENTPKKFSEDYNYLIQGIDENIKIYMQILTIIQHPESTDIEISVMNLKDYRDNCRNYYALINNDNIKLNLPSSCLDFIDNVIYYANENIKARKEEQIIYEQNVNFLDSIEKISNSFIEIRNKRNYTECLKKARIENPDYDDILFSIEDDLKLLNELISEYDTIIPTNDSVKIYETYSSILDNYKLYLDKLRFAIDNEKTQALTGNLNGDVLMALYTESNKLFETINSQYEDYKKLISDFKLRKLNN